MIQETRKHYSILYEAFNPCKLFTPFFELQPPVTTFPLNEDAPVRQFSLFHLPVLFAVFLCAAVVEAERIPLRSGSALYGEIVTSDSANVTIKTPDGSITLPWSRISPEYPKHPQHPREESRTPPRQQRPKQPLQNRPSVDADQETVETRMPKMVRFLVVSLLLFWLNIFSIWLISREDLVHGLKQQVWNLAALILGLPAAVVFLLRYKGVKNIFTFRPKPARVASGEGNHPSAQLYTWDREPLSGRRNRKIASGLGAAEAVLARAVRSDASDVHFDTTEDSVKIAFRIDGILREPEYWEADLGRRTMTAIKMAAGMDVAKLQEAQDGACHMSVGDDWYDLRIARALAVNGETLVVRILKGGVLGADLTDLGMSQQMAQYLKDLTKETAGIIVMAGPTGSGKTSTIYGLLRCIQGTGRNILTIEDPVEYRLEDATQISLNARVGATFAKALKASMRHDPDVILVGEIRDSETMNTAFQASLTGHLVFTTIHASSVLATFGRLNELGLSSYMINTGLKTVVCQRLIRMLCPSCREAYAPDHDELEFWGLTQEQLAGNCFYRATGCKLCGDTGYHGRRGVFRILPFNNQIRNMIRPDVPVGELQEIVERVAMGKVHDYVTALLISGETSPEELRKTLDMFDFGKQLAGPVGNRPLFSGENPDSNPK